MFTPYLQLTKHETKRLIGLAQICLIDTFYHVSLFMTGHIAFNVISVRQPFSEKVKTYRITNLLNSLNCRLYVIVVSEEPSKR